MPLYEYTCESCRHDFEALVRGDERPSCPQCGAGTLAKRFSVPAAHTAANGSLPVAGRGGPCGMGGCGRPECEI